MNRPNLVATIAGFVAYFIFGVSLATVTGGGGGIIQLVSVAVACSASALVREAQGEGSWL